MSRRILAGLRGRGEHYDRLIGPRQMREVATAIGCAGGRRVTGRSISTQSRVRPKGLPLTHVIVAMVTCATVLACDNKVLKPASDSTPPAITWNVLNKKTNEGADHPAKTTLQAHWGELYHVTMRANDPEGVQSVEMGGESIWTCAVGSTVQKHETVSAAQQQTFAPDAQGYVLTMHFLLEDFDFSFDCQAGYAFTGGSVTLQATATNYFGGTATGTLKLDVSP